MRVRASLLLTAVALTALVLVQSPAGSAAVPAAPGSGIQPALAALAVELAEEARVAAAPPAPPRPRRHRLAVVRGQLGLSDRPGGPARQTVGPTTEFGSAQVLGVAAQRGDWLGVVSTARPNDELGWVRKGSPGLQIRRTRFSLHADLSARTLTLRRDGRRVHRLTVAIGRPGSETPTGRFAVTDKLSGSSYGAYYGCCILALSGHQPNLPAGWTGGNRLAIHGTDAPGTIGAAASAGCLRAGDGDLQVLMRKVPLGTPVFVRA